MSTQDTKLAEALKVLQPAATTILSTRPMDFTDETYVGFQSMLDLPMRDVLRVYEGTNKFLVDVRGKVAWSPRQSRAVANILRRALRGEGAAVPSPAQVVTCFKCQSEFPTYPDLMEHKRSVHGFPAASAGAGIVPVLPDFKPIHNIDLRLFPAARYAVEDNTGKLRFIIVAEVKRLSRLTGKFVWTKYRYANEYLDKGDRTVREQIGDTK